MLQYSVWPSPNSVAPAPPWAQWFATRASKAPASMHRERTSSSSAGVSEANLHTYIYSRVLHSRNILTNFGSSLSVPVDGDNWKDTVFSNIFDVMDQIGTASLRNMLLDTCIYSVLYLLLTAHPHEVEGLFLVNEVQRFAGNHVRSPAVHLQGSDCGHDDCTLHTPPYT